MNLAVLIPVIVAGISAVSAYVLAVRKASGSVASSTAEELWAESRSIRQDYARRISELNEVVRRCEARIDELEVELKKAHEENGVLRKTLQEQEKTIETLRDEIHRLSEDNSILRQENIRLRARVKELEEAQWPS